MLFNRRSGSWVRRPPSRQSLPKPYAWPPSSQVGDWGILQTEAQFTSGVELQKPFTYISHLLMVAPGKLVWNYRTLGGAGPLMSMFQVRISFVISGPVMALGQCVHASLPWPQRPGQSPCLREVLFGSPPNFCSLVFLLHSFSIPIC
jgi:hypothetical protein